MFNYALQKAYNYNLYELYRYEVEFHLDIICGAVSKENLMALVTYSSLRF